MSGCNHLLAVRTVTATRYIRRMRGGTRPQLIHATDGNFYVLKALHNPQGSRILVNELFSGLLLRNLGVLTPETVLISVGQEFIRSLDPHAAPLSPGVHIGSQYAAGVSIYDFVPSPVLRSVYNREDFFGALVFDQWVANIDARQAIFYRADIH